MAISKRLRFEIFRRDGYACRYCGRRAPAVILEVDHQIPVSRGGTDHPDNLISACLDCNRGKGPLMAEWEPDELAQWKFDQQYTSNHYELVDELPRWMREHRKDFINLRFDIHAAAAELPAVVDWNGRYRNVESPNDIEPE